MQGLIAFWLLVVLVLSVVMITIEVQKISVHVEEITHGLGLG